MPAPAAAARILHVIESDGLYGAEQVVLHLAQHARANDPRFTVAIGCLVPDLTAPNALYQRAVELGLEAHKIPLAKTRAPFDVVRFAWTLRRLGVRLVHAHGYKAEIAGYFAHRTTGAPLLVTCHLWFEESSSKWTYRVLSGLERFIYPRLPAVVAVSPPIAEQLRRWGVSEARLEHIPNGIDIDRAIIGDATRARLRREIGAGPDSFVVVNVGRLAAQKGQSDLIDAAAKLVAADPDVRVVVLGEGHLRQELETQIARAGLESVVRILGFRPNVHEYLQIADVFALPSLDEGLPIALLEALSAEVPVVCTPVGAIPELLVDGENSLFVPVHGVDALAAALDRLRQSPTLRKALAERGRRVVEERYSAAAMYWRYAALYARLTGTLVDHDAVRR